MNKRALPKKRGRKRRSGLPRYDLRVTPNTHKRLQQMGTFEKHKFAKFVREQFPQLIDRWETQLPGTQPNTP